MPGRLSTAPSAKAAAMKDTACPKKASVLILTGFLGAGKTTLLNRILTGNHGRRIAVVVNEFGEVGIDHHLLISSEQEVIQMNNGCICCTVRGDLLRSFFELSEHRAKFDTVVIETTGLAEPAPVAQTLYADERLRSEFALEGVITVVDAKHVTVQMEESAEACEQIAFADLIVLNKTDLVTADELDRIERQIGGLNKVAKICRAKNAELDLGIVFGVEGVGLEQRIDAALAGHAHDDHNHDYGHGQDGHGHHHHRHHNHLRDIMTVCIVEPGALDGMKLSVWFRSQIVEFGANLLRMKGILNLRGDQDQFLFQGVRTEFEGRPGRSWRPDEERLNRLVFIGHQLDHDVIARGFANCVYNGEGGTAVKADPFGRDLVEISPLRLDQIRYWMRQNFGFAKETPIAIKEVPCVKPRCPPIETAIVAVLQNEPPRHFKIQRSISEITFDNVYDLIENPLPCC
jgi:G3E family GTPase